MPTQLLALGMPWTITQNTTYALPAKLCNVKSSAALESSVDGTTWGAVTGADTTGAWVNGVFIRCTTGNALVLCKA